MNQNLLQFKRIPVVFNGRFAQVEQVHDDVTCDTRITFYSEGNKLHSTEEPTILELKNGTTVKQVWMLSGTVARINGPAIEYADQAHDRFFYENGILINTHRQLEAV